MKKFTNLNLLHNLVLYNDENIVLSLVHTFKKELI